MSLSPHSAGGSIWAFGAGSRACHWLPPRTPLSSHTVSPRAGDWGYLGRSEPTVGSFPSLQRTSLLPLGSFSHQGKHRRHTGRHCLRSFTGPAPAPRGGPGGPRFPLVCVGAGCAERMQSREQPLPRALSRTHFFLSPSLLRVWPASRTFSQSGVVTGLPAGLDVLPAFQRVYDRLQMCLQEHTVPRAEINAGLTAGQAHTRERRRKTKTV